MKKRSLLILLMGLIAAPLLAQPGLQAEGFSFVEKPTDSRIPDLPLHFSSSSTTTSAHPTPKAPSLRQSMTAPKAYQFEHLAFFCKIEVKLEKKVAVPLKFRLGTVDYVDRLEQKISDY